MTTLKRFLAWVGKLAALTAGIAVVLGLVAIVFAGFTTVGSGLLSSLVSSVASAPGRVVTVDGLGPLLTGKLTARSVTLADERGVYGRIDDLAVDWSPLALISATFKADRVAAGKIDIQRLPESQDAATGDDADGFKLPLRLDIAAIALPSIHLGPELAGQALSLAAQGSLTADETLVDADLVASRKDQADTRLTARISFAPADNRLVLDGAYTEPKAGILGTLLRVPGQPAIDLNLAGEGPLSDWKGKVTASLDGQTVLSVDATHRLAASGWRQVGATGGGQFASLLPPSLRSAFAGETSIDFSATLEGDNRVVIDTANLATGSLLLTASGTIDQAGQTDLKANLIGVGGPVALNWPVDNGTMMAAITGIDLSASGPAKAVKVDLTAALESLVMPDLRLDGVKLTATSPGLDIATRSGPLDLTIALDGSHFDNPSLERALRAPLTVKAPLALTADNVTFDKATVESAGIGGTMSGQYGLKDGSLTFGGKLFAVPDVFPSFIGQRLRDTVQIAGHVTRDADGAINAEDLDIVSDIATIRGSASLVDGSLTSDLQGEVADIGKFVANAEGTATFSLDATGPMDASNVEARVMVPDATLAGRSLTGFELTARGVADPKAPMADIKAEGTIDGQPISLESRLETEEGHIRLPVLSATVGPNTLTGALSLGPDYRPSGNVSFDLPRIELVAALAGQMISGDLKGSVRLAETSDSVSLELSATGTELRHDTAVVTAPAIQMTITDLRTLAVDGTARAERIASGTNLLDTPVVAFTRAGNQTLFDLKAVFDGKPLATRGQIAQGPNRTTVTLDQFTAAPKGVALKLAAPASMEIAGGTVRFDGITAQADSGTVRVKGSAGRELAINAAIERLPAALVNAFAPTLSAGGSISGTLAINGTAAAPLVDYRLTWSDAAVAQTRGVGLPPLTIAADGRLAGRNLTLNANVTGTAGVSVRGGGTVGLEGTRQLSLNFAGNVPLGLFAGQMSAQGLILEGAASMDIKVGGTATAPVITGRASLSGGRLIDARRNLTIEALTATVALEGDRANIASLSGRLSGGGTISGSGSIDIRSPNLPADLTIRLDRAAYADGSLFTSSASGDLALKGPLTAGPVLSGALTLGETAITVPERLPAALSELDITHKNAPADVRRQMASVARKTSSGASSDTGLDLNVSAPSRIFVRGRGIDAELGGAVTIRGTASNPAVSGAFTLTRGRLSILTKRLTFTSGTITFGGNLIPLLNMEATTTSGSTTITVTISGLANDPSISFSSSPALPQDEILAQLIFGQSMSKLSALQIAQLADAASQLAGGRSSSLFETLRSGLGVDNLDISTDAEGNAAVSAGKYLNDRTYIELQQSDSGTGKAVINLDIGKGVKLRGEAGGDGSTGAGIFYEKEY